MKKILLPITFMLFKSSILAQVIFGDNIGTATDKTSVLVEFANSGNHGLVLPYLTDTSNITTAGSLILDATTPTAAKVKYYNGTTWIDLSVQPYDVSSFLAIQPIAMESTSAKVIIGNSTSSAAGILVLESTTKAMVLPIVSGFQNIINPAPGMMTFINNGGIKSLAVYNGGQWSFWSY